MTLDTAAAPMSASRPATAAAAAAPLPGSLLERADLFLCLSRAFLPPPPGWSVCDWAAPLADDLGEIGSALALDMGPVQSALEAECRRWAAAARQADGSADSWLVEYARLFLMPPVPVPLNTGLYLEGSLAGGAAQMMQACYETAGIVPDERFRDLPDHAAMQLEFLGRLYERAARGDGDAAAMADEFSREFIHAWGEPLERACAQAIGRSPAAAVYRALTGLLRTAVDDTERQAR
jgi:TorA maturation chaperone TorD